MVPVGGLGADLGAVGEPRAGSGALFCCTVPKGRMPAHVTKLSDECEVRI